MADEQLPAPLAAQDFAADEVGDVPPLLWTGGDVEIVPFAPARVAGGREMESIEFVIELLVGRRDPG